MIITIFRSRLRPDHPERYAEAAARMAALAQRMPGFVSLKTFTAPDGERVSLVEVDSWEAHEAWRTHPEHLESQRFGRELFYSEYRIQVCTPHHEAVFPPRS
jgi:heme-degrading monooxygenase HmoA